MQVLLIEDHPLIADSVALILTGLANNACVSHARCCSEARSMVQNTALAPDLIILDPGLPDGSGLDCVADLRRLVPSPPLVVFSGDDASEMIRRAASVGARGFIHKSANREYILCALRLILAGGTHFPSLPELPPTQVLSNRQRDVLELLAAGKANKQIGAELGMAEATVRQHITAIFKALGVRNRTEAALRARKVLLG